MNPAAEIVDVFLCHTGANKDWVRNLATRLEGEEMEGRPLRVFFDEWDIAPGDNILSKIEDGLTRARFLAVALSPALSRADWPTLEWQSKVYDDPTGKRGRIIPLIVEKFDPVNQKPLDIPLPLRLLRHLDFSVDRHFENQYQLLLCQIRGQPQSRGRPVELAQQIAAANPSAGSEAASLVDEVLLGNLFPATAPRRIYSDISAASSFAEIRKSFARGFRTPFVLHSGRLYSFVPPKQLGGPFRRFLVGSDPRVDKAVEFIGDSGRARLLIWLCNAALRERCYALGLRTPPGEQNRFYPVVSNGKKRVFSWGKGAPVTLAKVTSGNSPLGVHHAASMRFIEIGNKLYLLVEPRYVFTTDGFGRVDRKKAGRYSVRWGGREGNYTVLRRTLMWPRILSEGRNEVTLRTGGPESVRVAVMPLGGRSNQGILGDAKDIRYLLQADSAGEVFEDGDELDAVGEEYLHSELDADDEGPDSHDTEYPLVGGQPGFSF